MKRSRKRIGRGVGRMSKGTEKQGQKDTGKERKREREITVYNNNKINKCKIGRAREY